jgi:hypothetical protein
MGFSTIEFLENVGDLREFLTSKVISLRVFEDDHTRAYGILNANEIVACKKAHE